MPIRQRYIEQLRPYLVGDEPKPDGEWDMFCPLHEDAKRSASLNVEKGTWYCHAEGHGGRIFELIALDDDWVDPPSGAARTRASRSSGKARNVERITEARVQGWTSALLSNEAALDWLTEKRGLTEDTIVNYDIGWDSKGKSYTIPVRSDDGGFWNVRFYKPNARPGQTKILSYATGYGAPRLYPIQVFDGNPKRIIVCEGEWDTLLTIQRGYPAITRTGAAKVWKSEWGEWFQDRTVYLAHDCDEAGRDGNRIAGRALRKVAREIYVLKLPYPIERKHGKDLTDFWLEHDVDDFDALLRNAEPFEPDEREPEAVEPNDVSILDSFDARRVGEPLRMVATIKGKRAPGYSVPRSLVVSCTRDAGPKCNFCPLNAAGGDDEFEIPPSNPTILEMMESTKQQMSVVLATLYGVPGGKCPKLNIDVSGHQAVEILYGRPSVEHMNGHGHDEYTNVKITSVGRHDTSPNNTVQIVGALHPDPRKQSNEFLAWEVNRLETSLDRFEMNDETVSLMETFCPEDGQRPLAKVREIADDLAAHVTRIYGRPEMHALIDLVFHSALSFRFGGTYVDRGWLEALVVGDTRTGKSEAAKRICEFYQAGEMITCESASFAGIIGGLQQYGSGKEWSITWGAVPINDRRLVVLDEVGGLHPEEIAQMSSVRSSGVAELTKIQQEKTRARTRLIWLGNPRNTTMREYTYGVQAIRPLIGNAEDIARFDLAMAVVQGEVPAAEINRRHGETPQRYSSAACAALVRWTWSRTVDQVKWDEGAEQAVFTAALDMGKRYVEDPPLIQGANVRVKIARTAVALAARTFSSTDDHQSILVKTAHVSDAVFFIDKLYGMPSFGYAERSRELIADRAEAHSKRTEIRKYLRGRKGLAKFLRNQGSFRRPDLEETLNCSKEEANGIINTLWAARMIRREKGDIKVEPTLHQLLREGGRRR